jgi:hypothetical protein
MNLVERLKNHFNAGSNVLITGAHGVGKTSIIKQVFEENGLVLNQSWLYFSGATLDPWVDFIGIPKEIEHNGRKCIEIIPPKAFANEGEIQAIFIDEFNRSPSKIRNALLELCQFKSINGRKFPNLKVVWAAINPEDEENTYDVERLDPAQKDRFPGNQIFVPYACDTEYFKNKYGKDIASVSIGWWNGLPDNIKKQISPRRLDYALEYMAKGIPLEDILPKDSNINKLRQDLSNGPIENKLFKIYESKNIKEAKLFLNSENNYSAAIKIINLNKDYINFFVPLIKKEKLCMLIADENMTIGNHILENKDSCQAFADAIQQILTASSNPKALMKIRSYFAVANTNNTVPVREVIVVPLSNHEYMEKIGNCDKKDEIKIILHNFPNDPDKKVCEKTIPIIVDFVSEKWIATIKQHNVDLITKIWNKCFKNIDDQLQQCVKNNKAFRKKCDDLAITTMMEGVLA